MICENWLVKTIDPKNRLIKFFIKFQKLGRFLEWDCLEKTLGGF
jgi:hypothetical protein